MIQLYQRNQFVALGLRQSKLSGESVGVVGQHFQIIGRARIESLLRQLGRILGRSDEVFLLNSELSILAIRDQRIRHIAECALNRLLISQEHLLVLCLGQSHSVLQPSSLEDWLRERGRQIP